MARYRRNTGRRSGGRKTFARRRTSSRGGSMRRASRGAQHTVRIVIQQPSVGGGSALPNPGLMSAAPAGKSVF